MSAQHVAEFAAASKQADQQQQTTQTTRRHEAPILGRLRSGAFLGLALGRSEK